MIIGILNLKGGSGKSTVTLNLVCYYAKKNKVLLIDTDEGQLSTNKWYSRRDKKDDFDVKIIKTVNDLYNIIKDNHKLYDYIIIDGAPELDDVAQTTINVSDLLIVPTNPSPFDLWGSYRAIEKVINIKNKNRPDLKAFILLNQYNDRTLIAREIKETFEEIGIPVLKSRLVHRVAYQECVMYGRSVLEWTDRKAKKEINSLGKELNKIINKEMKNG
jgi:chromosome partitioning protein